MQVDWIVQFTAPICTADYVHRVGRTARIGEKAYRYRIFHLIIHEVRCTFAGLRLLFFYRFGGTKPIFISFLRYLLDIHTHSFITFAEFRSYFFVHFGLD